MQYAVQCPRCRHRVGYMVGGHLHMASRLRGGHKHQISAPRMHVICGAARTDDSVCGAEFEVWAGFGGLPVVELVAMTVAAS